MRSVLIRKRTLSLIILSLAGLFLLFLGWRGDLLDKKAAQPGLQVSGPSGQGHGYENSEPGTLAGQAGNEQVRAAAPDDGSDFFVEYRLERERTRGQRVEWLREVINNSSSSAETRDKAQDHLLSISRNMEKEVELENLLRAEGFRDAAVFVDERAVNVVVAAEKISAEEKARAADLAARRTGVDRANISVIARR